MIKTKTLSPSNHFTSIRERISQLIETIEPFDLLEQQQMDFVLQWIDSGAEIFRLIKPAIPDTHLSAYFILWDSIQKQILLVDHKEAELWLPPGGHTEPGEYPIDTVKREAKEELGIEVEFLFPNPLFLTMTATEDKLAKHVDVSLWFLLKGDDLSIVNYDELEFNAIQWFTLDTIPYNHTDPHMERFIQKVKPFLTP